MYWSRLTAKVHTVAEAFAMQLGVDTAAAT